MAFELKSRLSLEVLGNPVRYQGAALDPPYQHRRKPPRAHLTRAALAADAHCELDGPVRLVLLGQALARHESRLQFLDQVRDLGVCVHGLRRLQIRGVAHDVDVVMALGPQPRGGLDPPSPVEQVLGHKLRVGLHAKRGQVDVGVDRRCRALRLASDLERLAAGTAAAAVVLDARHPARGDDFDAKSLQFVEDQGANVAAHVRGKGQLIVDDESNVFLALVVLAQLASNFDPGRAGSGHHDGLGVIDVFANVPQLALCGFDILHNLPGHALLGRAASGDDHHVV
ncbi:hypothetical protein PoMZ_01979 [Pyricularia oryzae]|uniref:Uncharacterized protein n=1 Tax=Pyricularia oryzae TaxID=318829 RepID=A0A4P7N3P1_PYROR|nr:hypothetical protein PoMZ_01979 [Pyricularia oryzae]